MMESSKKNNKPSVIVLGGHVQGYGIVKIFGQNEIQSFVFDTTKYNITKHSKYCKAFHKIRYDNLIDLLLKLGRECEYKSCLLFPTDDYYVRLLSQNKSQLNKYYIVTVDDWDKIEIFFNKRKSYPLAHNVNVPIPKTFFPNSLEELITDLSSLQFPCIIKPAVMLDFYRNFRKKVIVSDNREDLIKKYKYVTRFIKPQRLMIQEIIPGSSENQYSVGIFFDQIKPYNYLIARRKRQHPIDFGNATTYAETVNIPILKEYAHRILSKAKFFGLCEVEFKFDVRDKKFKFLEINPRLWKWHCISQIAEVPFLLSIYNYLTSGEPILSFNFKKAGWQDILTDFPVIFNMKRKGLYEKEKMKRKIHAVANANDIKPFLFQLLYCPYNLINR